MPVKFSKSARKFVKGKQNNFEYDHDYMKHKSKEELIKYLNDGPNKRLKRKVKIELERRNKIGKANVVFG